MGIFPSRQSSFSVERGWFWKSGLITHLSLGTDKVIVIRNAIVLLLGCALLQKKNTYANLLVLVALSSKKSLILEVTQLDN